MADVEALPADIFVDPLVMPEQEEPLLQALTALGVSARTRVVPPRRGADQLQWLILAALPLQAFLSTIGAKLAEDSYRGLQNAIRALLHRDKTPASRPLVLQDTATGLQIVLDRDLTDNGYQQLVDLDLSQFRLGPVRYDRNQGRWRSELDEAQSR
jgi:hypothetical protein